MAKTKKVKKTGGRRIAASLKKIAGLLLGSAAAAYTGLILFGVFCADGMVFPAPKPTYSVTLPGLEKIPMPGGGEAQALWLPQPGAKTAILHLHGNAQDLGTIEPRMKILREKFHCSVLAVDYPGYGLTGGEPSEAGTYRAAEAAFDHLVGVRGFSPEAIVLWGSSLGSGPAVELASHRHVKGVILESPFTSTFRTVTKVKLVPFDRFDNLAKIDRVQSPLLVISGERDSVVPFAHGKELVDAAVNAPVRRFLPVYGAEHNLVPPDKDYTTQIAEMRKIIEGR